MLFEVTFSDGTPHLMQAHNKRQLLEALQGVAFTAIVKRSACKACRKAAATVQHCLCATCYQEAVARYNEFCPDVPLEGSGLECLICSFFIGG